MHKGWLLIRLIARVEIGSLDPIRLPIESLSKPNTESETDEMMRIAQQQTACDAFHAHQAISANQHARILEYIQKHGHNWSIGELARALNLEKSTVSARVNELLASGQLAAKAKRKDRYSGITIRPVGLPAMHGRLAL